jgi:DNA-binding transcriptional ArsR family regulator
VFERVRGGARSVGEIAKGMDVSRPAVSQHLKVLKAARLVVDRAEGTRRLYGVDRQGLEALRKVDSTPSGMKPSLRSRRRLDDKNEKTKKSKRKLS